MCCKALAWCLPIGGFNVHNFDFLLLDDTIIIVTNMTDMIAELYIKESQHKIESELLGMHHNVSI